jgi:PPOX class probable F420-dependent enzyme
MIPDASTAFGARVRDRLAHEIVIWLTTVGADGTPQPNPVWFLWEGDDNILIYNMADAHRLAHLARRPRVSLNFDGNGQGGDIIVLTGDAEILADHPLASDHPAYAAKYSEQVARMFGDTTRFARAYPTAVRVRVNRVRGV